MFRLCDIIILPNPVCTKTRPDRDGTNLSNHERPAPAFRGPFTVQSPCRHACMSRASRVARAEMQESSAARVIGRGAHGAPPPPRALARGRLRHLPLRPRLAVRPHAPPPGRACVHGSVYPAWLRPPSRSPGAFLPTRVSSPQIRPSDERVVTTPPPTPRLYLGAPRSPAVVDVEHWTRIIPSRGVPGEYLEGGRSIMAFLPTCSVGSTVRGGDVACDSEVGLER